MIGRSASDNGNGQSLPGGFLHEIEGRSLDPRQRRRSLPPLASSDERRSISGGRSQPKPSSPASSVSSSSSSPKRKEKKKAASLWGWNPIKKALSQITGQRRFDCCFSLRVHSIQGLPAALSGIPLVVHWRRAADPASNSIATSAARVVSGVVQFEETLTYRCAVQGARTGPGGTAKYEARHFLIYSSLAGGAPELDLGRHLVDVTRVLPATLEELEDEKAFGSWSTSYRLSGKARGASLNVSFRFSLIRNEPSDGSTGPLEWDKGDRKVDLFNSKSRSSEDVKVLHEVLTSSTTETSPTANVAAKFDTLNLDASTDMLTPGMLPEPVKGSDERECKHPDCMMIEHGVETASDHQTCKDNMEGPGVKLDKPDGEAKIEGPIMELGNQYMAEAALQDDLTNLQVTSQEEVDDTESHESAMEGSCHSSRHIQESPLLDADTAGESENFRDDALLNVDGAAEDLNSIFQSMSALKRQEFPKKQLSHGGIDSSCKMASLSRSHILDAVTESVANEFLSVLGIEHSTSGLSADGEPESPREKLWKQFEKESLASGGDFFGPGDGIEQLSHCGDFYDDLDLSLMVYEAEKELEEINMAMNNSKSKVKMLEDAETEALMQEWGSNENNFNFSPPRNSGAFGSPIDLPTEEPLELPPLAEGLGPIVQTIDGGFLRSMSPFHFTNAKNKEKLIMQASSPVVLPTEMGSGIMEILQRLASGGIEKLSRQASKLMPLEDITGKTMRQIAWDSVTALDSSCESHAKNHNPNAAQSVSVRRKKSKSLARSPSYGKEMVTEYVALEDLAPMAMDKIEALSIEGLRIQTGTSDEEAPSSISAQSIGDASPWEGGGAKDSWSLGSESAGSDHDIDGLMGLSLFLSLNEWMKLDSGTIDEEERGSDRVSKILAAHHANSVTGGKSGKILRNDFTVALRVQLRDPLRNFEPVGTPMLALIQVERSLLHPKPKIYENVNEREDGVETEAKQLVKGKHEGAVVPRFQVTEVHVAGLSTEPSKITTWGDPKQQQSGSRLMFATGMGKDRKHPSMEPKAAAEPSQGKAVAMSQPGGTLWSISSRVHSNVARWKGLASVQPHTRNPNIVLPDEISKLR